MFLVCSSTVHGGTGLASALLPVADELDGEFPIRIDREVAHHDLKKVVRAALADEHGASRKGGGQRSAVRPDLEALAVSTHNFVVGAARALAAEVLRHQREGKVLAALGVDDGADGDA